MQLKRGIEDYALFFIIGGLYAFAVNLSILTTTIVYVPAWALFLTGVGMLAFFALVFWNRYTMLAFIGFLFFLGLSLYWMRDSMEDFWYFVEDMIMITRGELNFSVEFTWPLVLAICILTGLFIAVCLYVNFHFYMLGAFGAAIFIICWIMDYPQSLAGFIIFLFCFCVFLIRKLQGSKSDGTRSALVAAPLCALVVWSVTLVPVPTRAIDNDTVNRLLNEPWDVVSEFFFLAFNPRYFSFQTTGFAGHGGRLGGPVAPNHRSVMGVDAPRRIYLSGATHNIYTGYGWTTDSIEFLPPDSRLHPSYIEFMETANALFRHTGRLAMVSSDPWNFDMAFISYMPISTTNVFVGSNRTGSLFRPMRETGIIFDNPGLYHMVLVNASGDRRLTELIPRYSSYRFRFLDIDYRQAHIQDILRTSRRGLYRDRIANPEPLSFPVWENGEIVGHTQLSQAYINRLRVPGLYDLSISDDPTFPIIQIYNPDSTWGNLEGFDQLIDEHVSLINGEVELFDSINSRSLSFMYSMKQSIGQDELLAEYADFVFANYMQLPDTLPQRVIDLAFEITYGYETDYDRVRALQEFLIQFPYTLSPTRVPRDRDFVDYFLFDGQEGYCVYYASAMVVMTRAIGIPARYVEGFLMPGQRDMETGLFAVSNRNAHAWAEVYFEGFGWLIVETTAPYVYAMYERPFFAFADIFADGFSYWDFEEQMRQMGLWYAMHDMEGWDFDVGGWGGVDLTGAGAGGAGGLGQGPVDNLWQLALSALIALVSLIILYFSIWHILWALRLRKLRQMDAKDQIAYYYREILKITKYWRYPLLEEETSHEYGQRLRFRFGFMNDTIFIRDLNDVYYRARYGESSLSEEDVTFMKNCYYELVQYVQDIRGRHKYFFIRYFKGVIAL